MNQPGYIGKILKQFNITTADSVKTPLPYNFKLINNEELLDNFSEKKKNYSGGVEDIETSDENQSKLKTLIGLLMHLSIHTRPDISFSVTLLSTKLDITNYC